MPARPKTPRPVPSDEEILAYDSVPVDVAGRYIGMSMMTLYRALQEGKVPFGFSVPNDSAKTYSGVSYAYNISPGLLVAYKRGHLQIRQVVGTDQGLSLEQTCPV